MRSVSDSFSLSIANAELAVTELYTITTSDGVSFYYCNFDSDIEWGGITYKGNTPISRGNIGGHLNNEHNTLDVVFANVSGDLSDLAQRNVLDNCEVTITRIWRGAPYATDNQITVFVGNADIDYNRQVLVMHCKQFTDSLNLQIPRHTYQEPCNHSLFDVNCNLQQSSFSYCGVADTGSQSTLIDVDRGIVYQVPFDGGDIVDTIKKGDAVTGSVGGGTATVVNINYEDDDTGTVWYCGVAGTQFVNDENLTTLGGQVVTCNGGPVENNTLYRLGELHMRSGNNEGQRRPVLSDVSFEVTTMWPMPYPIDNGDSYTLYPGCDGQGVTCQSWYGNDDNFRGFLYIPRYEETIY